MCWMYGEVRWRGETELNALRCRQVSGRSLETNDRMTETEEELCEFVNKPWFSFTDCFPSEPT